ncbi:NAD-dependent epimerase/dehydratase family protein [Natrarchaeobaculum aegyptiacum]|uniref:UDP-glucose 4-epimerase n=1 Tax=Natrarchaeobaculum aegyptiacum TaxID=745377 RepID=A0A2Z2HWI6_9EURY|nr:NAD-dependent epimerase/dehydratase family protein [Natrarchaeobaculum aegyptiacum]ARS89967.1 UDP-glucose 4-epimerase [Natrarchaeobaculum aegyptiacum]
MIDGTLTGKRVLVTGGAGFIGSHLTRSLVDENDVRVLDSLTTGDRSNVPPAATLIEGDVREEETLSRAMTDVDVVFHEAALVSVDQSIDDPTASHEINVRATLSLLEAARDYDARVVLASSAAIYGSPDSVPIAEDEPKDPASPYGIEKHAVDQYARRYHDLYGLETVALRYFNVYGPGQVAGDYSGVISIFVEQALAGDPITVEGDGEQTRDFVAVDDVVRANHLAATTDSVGTAYNVGTGTAITIRELAEVIRDLTGTDSEIVHVDPRAGDVDHSRADISRANDHLGFEPTVTVRDGLERTIEWYRDRTEAFN